MRSQLRKWVFGLLLVAGVSLAPAAFARSHVSVGVGINLPGVSIGFSDCRHCGYGHGWGGNYYGYSAVVSPAYYGGYYMPAYYESYPAYYGPAYYSPRYYGPSYYGGYYRSRPVVVHRTYYREHYRGDYGHRASYYDRGGYYRR